MGNIGRGTRETWGGRRNNREAVEGNIVCCKGRTDHREVLKNTTTDMKTET